MGVAAQRTDVERAVGPDLDVVEAADLVDVDEQLRRGEPQLEQRDQALPSREHLGLSPTVVQETDRLVERARRFITEPRRIHALAQLFGAEAGSGTATGSDS